MKIILVHNTYQQPGGEDAAFRNEYNLLTKAGHEVVRYVRSNHDVSHYVSVRQLALAKRTIWASDTREEFRQLLLRERPEIVHVHNTFLRSEERRVGKSVDRGVRGIVNKKVRVEIA